VTPLELAERALAAAEGDEAEAVVHSERSGVARFAASEVHQPTLIENTGVRLRVVRDGKVGSAYSTVSLSTASSGDEELDPLETIGAEDEEFERSEDRAALAPALAQLPAREREILRMRFEEGLPQTQIAQRVGLSQMHVSRLIRKSLTMMREELA
jgi:RNA polymerase sigma factor (sigma-70 family)